MTTEATLYQTAEAYAKHANMDSATYQQWYQASLNNPESFWLKRLEETLTFEHTPQTVCEFDFKQGHAAWFKGIQLNASVNCIDRHLPKRADQTAIIWEGDEPDQATAITYQKLHDEVCKIANVLKNRGVKKGDRICIYMPMIPEAAYSMLACARIGAVHSVVFGGFSPEALKDRILDSDCTCVITADEGIRAGKRIPLKNNADQALTACPNVHTLLVVKHSNGEITWNETRDIWHHEAIQGISAECPAEMMEAEDPLFILYTSGSTGKPKGVLHTTAGYLLQVALTHKYVLDSREGDIYWCTADLGWVTGHSYILYGPLVNGSTTLMFAGVPTYPSVSRCWEIIDKHQVNVFYTAPTAIRALMAQGDEPVKRCDRQSLRLLGTVGEPINPEAWEWYFHTVGDSRCPIVDTWWQTETGAMMIAPIPGAMDLKPGAATLPFFGVELALMNENGQELQGEAEGNLVIKRSWPSQIRTVFGNHSRCIDTYYSAYPGCYFTGDGAKRDKNGCYWITGRVDDVLNVSGHRLGTAEIESALVLHESVAEAAVVGYPHEIKGQGIYVYISLMKGVEASDALQATLKQWVSKEIGPIAKPDQIQWTPNLPKTRSGKIMRRILRKIAAGEYEALGDTSTLADPSTVQAIVADHQHAH